MGVFKETDQPAKTRKRINHVAKKWKMKGRERNGDDSSSGRSKTSIWKRFKCSVSQGDTDAARKSRFGLKRWSYQMLKQTPSEDNPTIPKSITARSQTSAVSSMEDSSVSVYAAATASVAKRFYNENNNPNRNALYRPSSSLGDARMVFPVTTKRDMYVQHQELTGKGKIPSQYKSVARNNRDPLSRTENILKPYSISGSMLCSNMEKAKAHDTSVPQTMFSPQRPTSLPVNTIMGSMLYRSMQHDTEADHVLKRTIETKGSSSSSVSSITQPSVQVSRHDKYHPNGLLGMLQSNSFEDFDDTSENRLFEA